MKEKGALYDLESKQITTPQSAYEIAEKTLQLSKKASEHLFIFTLTTKCEVAGIHLIYKGGLNVSMAHQREILQAALLNNAAAILCLHNHPSGDPTPSEEDIKFTKKLEQASKLLNIDLFDHIIIGDDKFISLKEKGFF